MKVDRIRTDDGGRNEPPLDPAWDDLTKLRWWAAVVEADYGVQLDVDDAIATSSGQRLPWFEARWSPSRSGLTGTFHDVHLQINAFARGYEHGRQADA